MLLLGQGCTTVSSSITLPAAATLMSSAGGLDTGYRLTVAARDGWLYSVRGGALSKTVIQLDSQPVGLVSGATTSPLLATCRTLQGLCNDSWPVVLPAESTMQGDVFWSGYRVEGTLQITAWLCAVCWKHVFQPTLCVLSSTAAW